MTRAQQTILAVVFTLVGMGVMLSMTNFSQFEPEKKVNNIITDTKEMVPQMPPPRQPTSDQRTEGLPPRPPPQAPQSADEWRQQREQMAKDWRQDSIKGIEAYAEKSGMAAETRQQVLDVILEMHDKHEALRAQLETNSIDREAAKEQMEDLDLWIKAEMYRLLGEDGAEAMRLDMDEMKRTY